MGSAADARGSEIDPALIGLGVVDELRNRLDRNREIDLHHQWITADARDRRNVANEIEFEVLEKRDVNRVIRGDEEQRIAIRKRPYDRLGADITGAARPVFDDKRLAKAL